MYTQTREKRTHTANSVVVKSFNKNNIDSVPPRLASLWYTYRYLVDYGGQDSENTDCVAQG